MSEKVKFALYLEKGTKDDIERRFREDGSTSQTVFVENAVKFYLKYLSSQNAAALLPTAVRSCIEGQLGLFEDRVAKLLYKLAIEHNMGIRILTDCINLDEEYLRKQRAKSVADVKRTNGQLRFEEIARGTGDA